MQIGSIPQSSYNLASSASGAASAVSASSFAYYDPKDTNRDGIVSPEENYQYSLEHPEAEALQRPTSPQSSASPFTYHDPKDINQDGVVSPQENYIYTLNHPELGALHTSSTAQNTQTATGGYTPQGTLSSSGAASGNRLLDVYA